MHFYDELIMEVLDIIETSNDCVDVRNDIAAIKSAVESVKWYGVSPYACTIDNTVRNKYPTINAMLRFANSKLPESSEPDLRTQWKILLDNLQQDYYGIILDTGIKKGLKKEIKDFIKCIK